MIGFSCRLGVPRPSRTLFTVFTRTMQQKNPSSPSTKANAHYQLSTQVHTTAVTVSEIGPLLMMSECLRFSQATAIITLLQPQHNTIVSSRWISHEMIHGSASTLTTYPHNIPTIRQFHTTEIPMKSGLSITLNAALFHTHSETNPMANILVVKTCIPIPLHPAVLGNVARLVNKYVD